MEHVLGYPSKEVNSSLLFEILHPEDRYFLINFEEKLTAFVKSLPRDEYPYYKFQYNLRFKTKNNVYKRLLIQYVLSGYDQDNLYNGFHIHTDITHIKQQGDSCVSIIGIDGRPSYYNIKDFTFTKSYDLFTKRERNILKEIIEGKTSQQIADELFISFCTVNAHRRNILEKAEVKTPLELVQKTLREDWI